MATSNLKRIAAQTLATWLVEQVPELEDLIHTVAPEPTDRAQFPCVAILAQKMSYEPAQADEVYWNEDVIPDPDLDEDGDPLTDPPNIDDGKLIMNVGAFTGVCEIRVYAKNVAERERLEERILHAFLSVEMAPGVVAITTPAVTVNEYVTLYEAPVAFMLDSADWTEEYAFENRRFSFMDLDMAFPALVVRGAYRLETLQLAITEDLESDTAEETVEIDEDGELSNV